MKTKEKPTLDETAGLIEIRKSSVFGNFSTLLTATITHEQALAQATAGVHQIVQRVPASRAERAIAYPLAKSRPNGFERNSIPFTVANAETLRNVVETESERILGFPISFEVSEHVTEKYEAPWKREAKAFVSMHARGRLTNEGLAEELAILAAHVGISSEEMAEYLS